MKILFIILFLFSSSVWAQAVRYDWGPNPSEVLVPTWPNNPSASVSVDVGTSSEFTSALALGDRRINFTADITVPGSITISTNDNLIDLNGFTLTSNINTDSGMSRVEITNGVVNGNYFLFGQDILFDNVNIVGGAASDTVINATRFAIINSNVRVDGTNFLTESASYGIFANTLLEAVGPLDRPAIRVMSADRLVIVDSRLVGFGNSPLRLHVGDPPATRGSNNIWVARTDVIAQGIGAFWINRTAGAGAEPSATMRNILVEDNTLYNTNFDINSDSAADIPLYFDITIRRNHNNNGSVGLSPFGFGGDTANGYIFHVSGPDTNTTGPSITIPAFTGGYESGGNPPVQPSGVDLGGLRLGGQGIKLN